VRSSSGRTWQRWLLATTVVALAGCSSSGKPGEVVITVAGVGATRLEVWRVTKDPSLVSWGPTVLARVGYDFGERPGLFVLVDIEAQDQASGAVPWGPSLQVGVRF
jgi:hypothetical protein